MKKLTKKEYNNLILGALFYKLVFGKKKEKPEEGGGFLSFLGFLCIIAIVICFVTEHIVAGALLCMLLIAGSLWSGRKVFRKTYEEKYEEGRAFAEQYYTQNYPDLKSQEQASEQTRYPVYVALRTTPLRAGPDAKSPAMKTIAEGTQVQIVSNIDSQWWLAETPDGKRGYLLASDLENKEQREENQAHSRIVYPVYAATRSTALKTGTDRKTSTITTIPEGMNVKFISSAGTDWCLIETPDGTRGYSLAADFEIQDKI